MCPRRESASRTAGISADDLRMQNSDDQYFGVSQLGARTLGLARAMRAACVWPCSGWVTWAALPAKLRYSCKISSADIWLKSDYTRLGATTVCSVSCRAIGLTLSRSLA